MSHQPLRARRHAAMTMRHAAARFAFLVTLLLGIAGLQPALGQAADATVTHADFCSAWNQSTSNPEITLASGYKITGSSLVRTGTSCNDADAEISVTNSALEELPAGSGGNAASRLLAAAVQTAVSSNDMAVGDEVFKGATIKTLTITLSGDLSYLIIRGSLEINFSGGTVTKLGFAGRLYGVDRYSMALFSPAGGSVLPNIGGDPITFNGGLTHAGSTAPYVLNLDGTAPLIKLGSGDKELTVKNAKLHAVLADEKSGTGLKLHATGDVSLGSAVKLTDGTIDAEFDDNSLVNFQGGGALDVTIPASGSNPAGSITGNAQIAYQRDGAQSVTFTGDVRFGEALIAGASGSLDAQSATFTGDVTLSNADLSVKGDVDGIAFYGDDLTGRTVQNRAGDQVQAQKGDGLIKSAHATVTAKGLTVDGSAQVGNVGGDQWADASGHLDLAFDVSGMPTTTIDGSAALAWVKGSAPSVSFKGAITSGSIAAANVEGTADGDKIAFKGDGTLSNPDLTVKGAVDGVVYYGNGSSDKLKNKAGDDVTAQKGDFVLKSASADITTKGFALSGAASVARVGGDRWASGGGDVDLTLGDTNLKGHADMTWSAGELPAVQFSGSIKQGDTAVANVSGSVDGSKLSLKGDGTLNVNGLSVKGAVDGTLYYGNDLSGQTIDDGTGTQVPAHKGDYILKSASADVLVKGLSLGGGVALGSVNGHQWAKAGGNVDVTYNGTHIVGSADLAWSEGDSPAVAFKGSLTSGGTTVANAEGTIDGKKIAIKGDASFSNSGVTAKGTIDGIAYYADPAGDTLPNADGTQVAAQKGDYLIKSASGQVSVKNLDVSGDVSLGKVAGTQYAKGGGTVDVTQGATNLKGSAGFTWTQGSAPTATFSGTVTSGTTTVANASGTLDGKKLALKGDASIKETAFTASGAIEGSVYYADPAGDTIEGPTGAQVAAAKGDFVIKSTSAKVDAKGFSLTGNVSAGSAGGSKWAKGGGDVALTLGEVSLTGSANLTWATGQAAAVSFSGTVKQGTTAIANVTGSVDGSKLSLKGDGSLVVNGLTVKGAVDGTLYYGTDLAGQTIDDGTGKQVQASKGDYIVKSASGDVTVKGLALDGNVSLGSVGGVQWVKGGGNVDVTSGATHIVGSADLTWTEGSSPAVNFSGSLTSGTTTVANATGTIDGKKIAIKGTASFTTTDLTLSGAVDGVAYYADPAGDTLPNADGTQVAAQKGDYLLKSASGSVTVKNLALSGDASIGKVGGSQYAKGGGTVNLTSGKTTLKGSAGFSWTQGGAATVTFSGTINSGTTVVANASGTIDGKKLTFKGDASVTESSFTASGSVEGLVYYGDPAGDKIEGALGNQVLAKKGDYVVKTASGKFTSNGLVLNGNVSLGSVGGVKWARGDGAINTTFGNPATTIKGSATFSWAISGDADIEFEGTVTSGATVLTGSGALDSKKISLDGSVTYTTADLAIKGAITGTVYYGDPAGETLPNAAGQQVAAQKGDYVVSAASGQATVKNLSLSGNVKLGKVAGTQYASGGGSVDLTSGATNLKGSATFSWATGQAPSVTFSGSVTSGTTTVASVTGAIDGKKITLKGNATINESSFSLTGAIEGTLYYGDPAGDTITNQAGNQVAATKGDYYLKSASGSLTAKGTTLSGNVSAGKVGTQQWATGGGSVNLVFGSPSTTIKGSATFSWATGNSGSLSFNGSVVQGDNTIQASGTLDGKKLIFSGSLSSPTLSGNATGGVYYGTDLSGETIVNRSGATVAASRGDFYLTVTNGQAVLKQLTANANFTLKKVGAVTWANADAQIKVGTTFLTFTGELDSTGYVNLKGSGATTLDGYKITFSGSAVIQNNALTLTGNATVSTAHFIVVLSGTINKADMNSSAYSFVGTGSFKFGGFQVAGATIRLTTGEGLATSFQIKSCVLFVCTTGTFKLYFTGTEISKIQLSAPILSWPAFFAIAKITAPSIPVETTITGIL